MADYSLQKSCARRLIRDMIGTVSPEGGFKVMVVDHLAMRIMSSCLKMHMINDANVTHVENLALAREPIPSLECIYFVAPTQESYKAIYDDFKKAGEPMYKKAHLFFTSKVPELLFEQIKTNGNLLARLGSLVEINMEFLASESHVFSFDRPASFNSLVTASSFDGEARTEAAAIAQKLLTLCLSLDEFPAIRYKAGTRSEVSNRVASILTEEIGKLEKAGTKPLPPEGGVSSTLLILDRCFDPKVPLLHDFYVQGMCTDILKLQDCKFQYKKVTRGGSTDAKTVLLTEDDPIWTEIRHMFVHEASTFVTGKIEAQGKSKSGQFLARQARGEDVGDIKAMSDIVKGLQKFRYESERCSIAANVLQETMKNGGYLTELVQLEQDLAVGTDEDGIKISKGIFEGVKSMLAQSKYSKIEKLRLVLLLMIAHSEFLAGKGAGGGGGMSAALRDEMVAVASLGSDGLDKALAVLPELMADYLSNPLLAARKVKKKGKKGHEVEALLFARYVPLLHDAVLALQGNQLSTDDFPYMREPVEGIRAASGVGTPGTGGKSTSRGARSKPKWAAKQKKADSAGRKGKGDAEPPKQTKLIIFVVGGITYSEMRCAYELSKSSSTPVLIGSTNILHPSVCKAGARAGSDGGVDNMPEFIQSMLAVRRGQET